MTQYYQIADFVFAVKLKHECAMGVLLPSFSLFRHMGVSDDNLLFELFEDELQQNRPDAEFLEEDRNDLGHTRLYRIGGGYRVELRYADADKPHVIETDAEFKRVSAFLRWDDAYVSTALSSMLRIVFAQAILKHSAVSLHASAVVSEGKAYLFMGKSGTGKSTHSRLWLENVEGAWLLNDDNPIVRFADGKAEAFGSPWSGKTPCYRNEHASVEAMVRLAQAPFNRFMRKSDVEAFSLLLPGCSVLRYDRRLHGYLCETLIGMTEAVCVGEMQCLPDADAVRVCRTGIIGN